MLANVIVMGVVASNVGDVVCVTLVVVASDDGDVICVILVVAVDNERDVVCAVGGGGANPGGGRWKAPSVYSPISSPARFL